MKIEHTENRPAWEWETDEGFIILCQEAQHGNFWYTVLYRHIWTESGGPNSEILWVMTCQGECPDEDETTCQTGIDNLLILARHELPKAFERQT